MKFKEYTWSSRIFTSASAYLDYRLNDGDQTGQIELIDRKLDYLSAVVGRMLDQLPLSLKQVSEIVDGFDRELDEIDE